MPKIPYGPRASPTCNSTFAGGIYQARPVRVRSCAPIATAPFGNLDAKMKCFSPFEVTRGRSMSLDIHAGAPWYTVCPARSPCQVVLPGLAAFEGPAIRKDLIAD